jgi:hypothetical protein
MVVWASSPPNIEGGSEGNGRNPAAGQGAAGVVDGTTMTDDGDVTSDWLIREEDGTPEQLSGTREGAPTPRGSREIRDNRLRQHAPQGPQHAGAADSARGREQGAQRASRTLPGASHTALLPGRFPIRYKVDISRSVVAGDRVARSGTGTYDP